MESMKFRIIGTQQKLTNKKFLWWWTSILLLLDQFSDFDLSDQQVKKIFCE